MTSQTLAEITFDYLKGRITYPEAIRALMGLGWSRADANELLETAVEELHEQDKYI